MALRRRPVCLHVCPCGSIYICGELDRCTITEPWQCRACELDEVDRYVTRLERETQSRTDTERIRP